MEQQDGAPEVPRCRLVAMGAVLCMVTATESHVHDRTLESRNESPTEEVVVCRRRRTSTTK